jgi:enoyl-CoA hydratase/carnithine racemase
MVLSGDAVASEEALRIGLLTEIVEENGFEAAVQERVRRLGATSVAVAHSKRLLRSGAGGTFEAALAREAAAQEACFASAEFEEGMQAFLEKRSP